jgi:hypothetical protein
MPRAARSGCSSRPCSELRARPEIRLGCRPRSDEVTGRSDRQAPFGSLSLAQGGPSRSTVARGSLSIVEGSGVEGRGRLSYRVTSRAATDFVGSHSRIGKRGVSLAGEFRRRGLAVHCAPVRQRPEVATASASTSTSANRRRGLFERDLERVPQASVCRAPVRTWTAPDRPDDADDNACKAAPRNV